MIKSRVRWLGWGLFVFIILNIFVLLFLWLNHLRVMPTFSEAVEALGWTMMGPLTYSIVANLIINKQPGNRIGWLLMLVALTAVSPINTYLTYVTEPASQLTPGLWLLLWFDSWSWIPAIFPIFLIPLHFPTGKPPTPRWNWINYSVIFLWLIFAIFIALGETIGPLNEDWRLSNPIGTIDTEIFWEQFSFPWGISLIITILASVISLFVRYRRAQHFERQQIKWLLYAGALFVIYYASTSFLPDEQQTSGLQNLLFFLVIMGMPIAIAIAILRHRLYDIDLIIRKTLVYAVLSALLGLVYFGTVVLLQTTVGRSAGEQSPFVIVLSTLLIAALFSPLRRRIQAFIDRRFYRSKFDAVQLLAQFANTTRDEVDVDRLSAALVGVVEQTMRPQNTSVWIRSTDGPIREHSPNDKPLNTLLKK